MKTLIYVYLFINSLIGFGQNSSNGHTSNDKIKQEMITEFIKLQTDFEKQIDNNYQTLKKDLHNKSNMEKIRIKNIDLIKIMDDKINGILIKYNISKKDLYLALSEYYKNDNNIKH